MTKVRFTTVTEVNMDEFNPQDIADMGKSIAQAGKTDIEGVCQGATVLSVKAIAVLPEIDCLEEAEELPTV